MFEDNEKYIDKLADVIRELADVWPNDRDGVMVAGAAFEEISGNMDVSGVQLKRLMDLAWQGMIHLYEKDEFFITVKNATMHSVNTIREYVLKNGDIPVEDFERSCELMEKAISGSGESADKVVDLDAIPSAKAEAESVSEQESDTEQDGTSEEQEATPAPAATLNDLALAIVAIGDDSQPEELEALVPLAEAIIDSTNGKVASFISEVKAEVNLAITGGTEVNNEWLLKVSEKIEYAIQAQEDVNWGDAPDQDAVESSAVKTASLNVVEENGELPEEAENVNEFVVSSEVDLDMIGEFITECSDLIDASEAALLELESSPGDQELINTIFRSFHTIKGTSAFMGLDPVSDFTHLAETLLSNVRDGELEFDRAAADISLDSIDVIKKLLEKISTVSAGDIIPRSDEYKRLFNILEDIAENGVQPKEAVLKYSSESAPTDHEQQAETDESVPIPEILEIGGNGFSDVSKEEPKVEKSEQDSTVRVNLGRLDRLIDMVGELVIAHSVVSQDQTVGKDSELMKKINHTSKILRELQDTSLTLRMVPLKATFQKMNRLVRDLSRKGGKNVKLTTFGDDTEIDRNMVDIINEPLVHMLRNSIDHGVETPDERSGTSKPAVANIWLRAYQEGGKVVIEIEDDGRGINKQKVLQKAIDKKLVNEDQKLTDSEICALIFHPGLSSVDKVTELSGRGVGMDVVRRSIDQLQGKVEVESDEGKGTKVSLELPFTLAITDGMLVSVGTQKFIIPTINIEKTFRVKQDEVFTILGSAEEVKYRGNSVPVLRLHRMFEISGAQEDLEGGTLLVIKNNNQLYALLVDEIIGQQQLVGKSINMNVKMDYISGGAILGDGKVGLIIDTAALAS
ncbi:MAG: chemotaxis protein CheA [Balneolia bacterium]|nr:chemotaxis protein CheA [Balneolia bacterium]